MSAPQYAELRGVQGAAVAAKAELLSDKATRSLLFCLQALSLRGRGMSFVAKTLLDAFPDCIDVHLRGRGMRPDRFTRPELIGSLSSILKRFCVDPYFAPCNETEWPYRPMEGAGLSPKLFGFQKQYEANARKGFAETSISRIVWQNLDHSLKLKRFVIIEGNPGLGKSHAAQSWCEQHLGEARYVKLGGISNRTTFFATLSREFGLPSSDNISPAKKQMHVENFLRSSRLMLILDEGQFMLPQQERVTTRPELLDWITTSFSNEGIPCAILCWERFATLRQNVEQQTTWKSTHLSRRVDRYVRIEQAPTKDDFRTVAKSLLPEADRNMLDLISGYATSSRYYMSAVVKVITDAREIAEMDDRRRVAFADVEAAIEQCGRSDAAQMQALEMPAEKSRRRVAPLTQRSSVPETPLPLAHSSSAGARVGGAEFSAINRSGESHRCEVSSGDPDPRRSSAKGISVSPQRTQNPQHTLK
jgi:hypothetical protein